MQMGSCSKDSSFGSRWLLASEASRMSTSSSILLGDWSGALVFSIHLEWRIFQTFCIFFTVSRHELLPVLLAIVASPGCGACFFGFELDSCFLLALRCGLSPK